jgi:hypothetical protein
MVHVPKNNYVRYLGIETLARVSFTALSLVLCGCSEAPRTQDLAACALEAERTYPFGNDESLFSREGLLVNRRRSNYVQNCMYARGYKYAEDCDQLDLEMSNHLFGVCEPRAEKDEREHPSMYGEDRLGSPMQYCERERERELQLHKTRAVCYEPGTFFGKLALKLNPDHAPEYLTWCDEVLNDFQAAVKLDGGYWWTWIAEPLLPGNKCSYKSTRLSRKERVRLDQLAKVRSGEMEKSKLPNTPIVEETSKN